MCNNCQNALEYIDATITELETDLEPKIAEAKRKGWFSTGKKYQSINEMWRHMTSLKRLRTVLNGKNESE